MRIPSFQFTAFVRAFLFGALAAVALPSLAIDKPPQLTINLSYEMTGPTCAPDSSTVTIEPRITVAQINRLPPGSRPSDATMGQATINITCTMDGIGISNMKFSFRPGYQDANTGELFRTDRAGVGVYLETNAPSTGLQTGSWYQVKANGSATDRTVSVPMCTSGGCGGPGKVALQVHAGFTRNGATAVVAGDTSSTAIVDITYP